MPLSLISMVILLGLGLYDRTETVPFSGVNLHALCNTLQKTCCKRGSSATNACREASSATKGVRCRCSMSLRTISSADCSSSCASALRNCNVTFPRVLQALEANLHQDQQRYG